jgi:hypothetical protein
METRRNLCDLFVQEGTLGDLSWNGKSGLVLDSQYTLVPLSPGKQSTCQLEKMMFTVFSESQAMLHATGDVFYPGVSFFGVILEVFH